MGVHFWTPLRTELFVLGLIVVVLHTCVQKEEETIGA